MKEIVLVCTIGISTAFTVKDMMKSVKKQNLDINIRALALDNLYEVVESEPVDLVLLTPPVASRFKEIKTNIADDIPVAVVSGEHYVNYDGETILEEAQKHLK
ncbi:PTS system cellobiose-specific IIB component [Sinobaca qinghaiensis]|uniref:PTS system cellobiose-specific IIB component n=1 Tax=Sinobaca qinghaiensis TaxID=342944 RepID=A0A419V0B1_9BACL|nr:PTS sugar transporter subunit IIB [Sinobaca qinghaiensis]RKD71339.1 PTS system cellobiose-specific IIB component [Sinobaca qinghaiensis]